jgi:hypothetical protein
MYVAEICMAWYLIVYCHQLWSKGVNIRFDFHLKKGLNWTDIESNYPSGDFLYTSQIHGDPLISFDDVSYRQVVRHGHLIILHLFQAVFKK